MNTDKDYIDSLTEKQAKEILRRLINSGNLVDADAYLKFAGRFSEIKFFLRAMDETPQGGFIASTYVHNSMKRLHETTLVNRS